MERFFLAAGAIAAMLGVALGAFGAHALRARLSPELLATFETGVRYQMYHALALLALAWVATQRPGGLVTATGVLFIVGMVLRRRHGDLLG